MRCKGVRQSELGRELRAIQARSEDPDRNVQSGAWYRPHVLTGRRMEIRDELEKLLRKGIGIGGLAPKRTSGDLIRTRCAAKGEIDPTRKQTLERAELLCDDERRVV